MTSSDCPVCRSGNSRILFRMGAEEAGKQLVPAHPERAHLISAQIRALWESDRCAFYKCRDCGYGFARPYTAGNGEIYSTLYYESFSYTEDKWEHRFALELIQSLLLNETATLLEAGAGNGSFLERVASTLLPPGQIYSTELSDPGAKEIRRKGYHCLNKRLPELPAEKLPRFDVVCMFQVLEHMDDLDPVFQSLFQLGKPSSHLIIAVPNGYLRTFYDRVGVHLDLPPVHVGRFSRKTFEVLGKKHGWKIEGVYTESQSYAFKLKKFLSDRYVRVPLMRRTDQSSSKLVRYFFRYSCLLILAVRFLPVLFFLLLPGTGSSMMVHYRKKNPPV
ncbi:MAG TPA: class I SAM-dependent methyltransferase [Bacteroides sp.]|nr:class I SAM-dependent methyltransferase [Bacteroides sp.]